MSGRTQEAQEALRLRPPANEPTPEGRAEDAETNRLIERFQAGDTRAFTAIYSRHFDRVYAYLRLLLRNTHEAEDAAQQVFTQLFEALPRYRPRGGSFRPWLYTVVRNHAIDVLRKSRPIEVTEADRINERIERTATSPPPLESLAWLTDTDILLFIEHMPLTQRQVLVMRYLLNLTNAEIGEVLDRKAADVRLIHHRAIAFLRKRLAAIGRELVDDDAPRMKRNFKQAPVLRARRFSLL